MENGPDRSAINVALLVIRLVVGVIFLFHGSQLLFGLFGGGGIEATVNGGGGKPGMGPVGYLVAVGQFFGGLGLVVGILTRFSAAALIVIMLGAIFMVHLKNGFSSQNGGYEFNLALIGLLIPILIAGPGRFTVARPLPFLGRAGDSPHVAIE